MVASAAASLPPEQPYFSLYFAPRTGYAPSQRPCAQEAQLTQLGEIDRGADGVAARSRPGRFFTVLSDERSSFRDVGVAVARYSVTQLDMLRDARLLTPDQYSAGCHASALFRAARLTGSVVSRYEEWVSGARGQWVATDDAEDEAQPWREMMESLPSGPAAALEALVMGTLTMSSLPRLLEALDRIVVGTLEQET